MVIRFTTLMLILVSRAMFAAQCAVKWYAGKYGRLYARLFGQYDVSLEVCTYIVSFWISLDLVISKGALLLESLCVPSDQQDDGNSCGYYPTCKGMAASIGHGLPRDTGRLFVLH
jgi:hypothetical protein